MDPSMYFILNFAVTLIWLIIPWGLNAYRHKYGLPVKIVIWPVHKKCYSAIVNEGPEIIPGVTILGILTAAPIIVGYAVWRISGKFICWCVRRVILSKEEKVQIAIGSISKKVEE